MVSISLVLIVKNEAAVLERCLTSYSPIADEIIVVDTGSTDDTRIIAEKFTDRVYDFQWNDDFSAARNFAFSRATKDYIFSADADEVLDKDNAKKIMTLKDVMDPRVDIVQMYYANQLDQGTVYNYDRELRPKLFKRVLHFVWEEPVHEQVRLSPVIFDSDIEIQHLPVGCHSPRDFSIYQKEITSGRGLSPRLYSMYARELYVSGSEKDFETARIYFDRVLDAGEIQGVALDTDRQKEGECVIARAARLAGRSTEFFTMVLHNMADGHGCSEMCFELGEYYRTLAEQEKTAELKLKLMDEAKLWYYNAAKESKPLITIHASTDWPEKYLS